MLLLTRIGEPFPRIVDEGTGGTEESYLHLVAGNTVGGVGDLRLVVGLLITRRCSGATVVRIMRFLLTLSKPLVTF